MTDWDTYGPGRNGPYQKVTLKQEAGGARVFRICNRCGILYVQRDFNAGYCPQRCKDQYSWNEMEEMEIEDMDRQEETA